MNKRPKAMTTKTLAVCVFLDGIELSTKDCGEGKAVYRLSTNPGKLQLRCYLLDTEHPFCQARLTVQKDPEPERFSKTLFAVEPGQEAALPALPVDKACTIRLQWVLSKEPLPSDVLQSALANGEYRQIEVQWSPATANFDPDVMTLEATPV